jgi:hypothetical protein
MNRLINVRNSFANRTGAYLSTGPVKLDKLSDGDKGRSVVYYSPNSKEFGYLSSWNDTYAFVHFHSGSAPAACLPHQLQFIKEEESPCLTQ